MEELALFNPVQTAPLLSSPTSSDNGFMVANTQPITFEDLRDKCTIPVFAKDNESTISHQEFIDVIGQAAQLAFSREQILGPATRISHPIKGRIPSAVGKPANDLLEHEKTLYYERMAFIIEIPTIRDTVNENSLSLTLGGVRAYNAENLYGRKTEERFKLFIGFKNKVCTNLCVSTDGFREDVRVRTPAELFNHAFKLFASYNAQEYLDTMRSLQDYSLTDSQFAHVIGRLRMYPYMKMSDRLEIPSLTLGDSQINTVVRDYYKDESFCRDDQGNINLWRFYNLLTGANKTSYIDSFLDRTVNILTFTRMLSECLKTRNSSWYLPNGNQ